MNAPSSFPAIAIVGAGPAACALAAFLAARGVKPVVFDDGKRPEMLVGESLIPAVVPLLRRLGLEERVAAISQRKPGVSFLHGESAWIHFNFSPVAPYLPTYAYNVDRRAFDALLKTRAAELGAVFVPKRAGLLKNEAAGVNGDATKREKPELLLDGDTLAAVPEWKGRQPDLIVDAAGRARLTARLLDIPAERGPRDDVAYFAHYDGCAMPEPAGQVLIARLSGGGWSWRIPLPGKLSIGVVLRKELAKSLGATPEERLEAVLRSDPLMADTAPGARRISPVAVYTNYQLTSKRSFGPGWAAVGDAFGFTDPMLSSGLFLAMESAAQLDAALFDRAGNCRLGNPSALAKALKAADAAMRDWYASWNRLIETFYDGRIFSLYEAGHQMRRHRDNPVQHALDRFINKHIACMASGALTRSAFSQNFLKLAAKLFIRGVPPPARLAIR